MCGIFGIINFDNRPVDKEKVLSARDILAHRGPDDSGIYFSSTSESTSISQSSNPSNVALTHRRLSIIDLSPAAHQPMVSDDGRYIVVFNGEIYNYEALKEEVGSRQLAVGNKFKSTSDTEVILKLFELEGPECLNKLRGMFAFAIWDDKEKKLFAARDRFGIKPFYYLHNENEFIFSSELKAIKHYKNGLNLSMEGIDAFLRTGSVPAPLTIYKETKALMPGHYLTMYNLAYRQAGAQCSIFNYWNFNDLFQKSSVLRPQSSKNSEKRTNNQAQQDQYPVSSIQYQQSKLKYDDDAKQKITTALLNTVHAHMVSDVEVGAFLSGGIDSTAIVSLMRQAGQEKIKTVSVIFPGSDLDESEYARIAAKKYNTDHIEIPFYEKDLLNDLDAIFETMDQPTIDGINTYFVSKAASRAGLKVVLSGLGGDELFGGYPSFNLIPKYKKIKGLPFAKPLMKAAGSILNRRLPAKAIEYFNNPDAPNAEYRLMRGLFTDTELRSLGWKPGSQQSAVSGQWQNPKQPMTNDPMTIDQFTNDLMTNDRLSPLQYISYLESCVYMRNQLLRDSDVFSMTHSLELRVPFVDHILYSAVLPYLESGYDKRYPKKMLVDAVGDLPYEITNRSKMGFTFPFADWMMQGKLLNEIRADFHSPELNGLFDKKGIDDLVTNFENDKVRWSRVWALWMLTKFI